MKVLHINSYYGTSSFYKNLFESQTKSNIDIDVFVPVSTSFKEKDFNYGEYTRLSKNHNKYDRFIFHLKHNKIFKDIQDKYKINDYSLIHAHSLFSNGYVALKLKKKYGIPYIVAVRNTDVNLFFKNMLHLRQMGLQILNNADQIIFLSNPYKDEVINKYVPSNKRDEILKKTSIVPNGIDDYWFKNIGSPKKKLEIPYLRLLQVGDIDKNKNIETTVKVVDILIELGYKARLDVVGNIKDQGIFDKIKNLKYVNYLGYKSKEELIKIYSQNDIFLLPSIHETFGLVYAEAMSQGLPVIYTKGQGFDEQFEDGEIGFRVNYFDSIEIASKIIDIVDRFQHIKNNCINNMDKFKWDIISNVYNNIYKNIIEEDSFNNEINYK